VERNSKDEVDVAILRYILPFCFHLRHAEFSKFCREMRGVVNKSIGVATMRHAESTFAHPTSCGGGPDRIDPLIPYSSIPTYDLGATGTMHVH
jgi:hypothetical protein